jgi:hypothetical protein
VLDRLLFNFAQWLSETSWSIGLHESLYMFNWLESTHVLTLILSLGMLVIIDLRMLGVCFPQVSAAKIAERLDKPMMIGFALMFITGIILYTAIPIRYTTSVWFRFKMILLVCAAINAWLFRRHMLASVGTWDTAAKAPTRMRVGAALSLVFWAGVVVFGRLIAYDWYDCGKADNSAFINWAAGCVIPDAAP